VDEEGAENLEQAYEFIAIANPDAAVEVVIKIQAATEKLEAFPNLGKTGRVEGTQGYFILNSFFNNFSP
jgi:toxin ParE1/3/4